MSDTPDTPTPPLSSDERVEAAGAELRRSLALLGDEHPFAVYTGDGYTIWLHAVAARILTAAGIDALEAECDAQREVISRITDEATDLIGERDAAVDLAADRQAVVVQQQQRLERQGHGIQRTQAVLTSRNAEIGRLREALGAIAEGRWNHHTRLNTTARQFAQNALRAALAEGEGT